MACKLKQYSTLFKGKEIVKVEASSTKFLSEKKFKSGVLLMINISIAAQLCAFFCEILESSLPFFFQFLCFLLFYLLWIKGQFPIFQLSNISKPLVIMGLDLLTVREYFFPSHRSTCLETVLSSKLCITFMQKVLVILLNW